MNIPQDPDFSALPCPSCGETGDVHSVAVEMSSREGGKEDAMPILNRFHFGEGIRNRHTVSYGAGGIGRRQSIAVVFECMCGAIFRLRLTQHKGETQISTEVSQERIVP